MALEFPSIYLLPTHIPPDDLHDLEDKIPTLTYDITEAKVVLGKISTKQRATLELRSRGLWTTDSRATETENEILKDGDKAEAETIKPPRKKRRGNGSLADDAVLIVSSTESENEKTSNQNRHILSESQQSTQSQDEKSAADKVMSSPLHPGSPSSVATSVQDKDRIDWGDSVKVVKLDWFLASLEAGRMLPLKSYLIYEGWIVPQPVAGAVKQKTISLEEISHLTSSGRIRAKAQQYVPKTGVRPFSKGRYTKANAQIPGSQIQVTRPTHLLHQTTSEHDDVEKLPPLPDYLHTVYSCLRPSPSRSPNDPFICELKKIKLARVLNGDEIGVRAYSSSIASLAAYPYTLVSVQEVMRLPACNEKIASLYQEWKETGHISAVDELEADSRLQVLKVFYEIWGVGAATAREFYDRGWRDLDDVLLEGWNELNREQQIGLKFYDEFAQKIPRAEVESIGNTILAYANTIYKGFQMVIVGGYRRGKSESGDVDLVLTHPDETKTDEFINDIVEALEKDGYITHTLRLSTANSERGQTAVSWRGDNRKAGSGFDTLDKALVVWQDPAWPTKAADLAENPIAKNPAVHRRVDIIISPWKTAGCAIAGWTSGTTFQRDLRRYVRRKDLKFDSSGVRSRVDGHWVDLETPDDTLDLAVKEKRVFEGLGVEWREPSLRCTG